MRDFSFSCMFEKFPLNKQKKRTRNMKFLIFRFFKFAPEKQETFSEWVFSFFELG